MEFAFTEDQVAFRDAVRDLLTNECTPDVVRAAWPEGADAHGARSGDGARAEPHRLRGVWSALADMGVLGIAVPEVHGGLGLGATDWVLLAEESGYFALPHPFVESALVAAPLLAAAGDADELVPGLIDGSVTIGVAALDSGLVAWGDQAAALIVIDQRAEWRTRRVDRVSSLNGQAPAGMLANASLDGARHVSQLRQLGSNRVLGNSTDAEAAFDRGALGVAAQLVGLGRRMLDLTVAYVIERRQFGTPIGTQQAVKHHLADAALQLTFAAPAVYRAAWSLTTGADTTARDVSMAKAMASDAARLIGRKALQCHGAIGYTVEYDLHLYLKRAEVLARAWGDAAWHRNRVATALGI